MKTLSPKERLVRQATGQDIDCIPTIGGWIGGAANHATIAGISQAEYMADPRSAVIRSHHVLGVDAMVNPIVPKDLAEIRTGSSLEQDHVGIEPEALLEDAEKIPDSEAEVMKSFDAAAAEQRYRNHFETALKDWGGIQPIPNFWEIGGSFPLYHTYGYEAFLLACSIYPEAVGKIWWQRALHARVSAEILARLYRELDLIPLMFCGEDLCNNEGPMVSPEFLREHYFPLVRRINEPLREIGVRLIHHCDGDVRPLLGDFLECGFTGFQGFQFELGIEIADVKDFCRQRGVDPLFFTGMSVTRALPFGTPEDVRAEVEYFFNSTDGGRGMFLFTTNVSGVEVPPENLIAGYKHVKTLTPGNPLGGPKRWPCVKAI